MNTFSLIRQLEQCRVNYMTGDAQVPIELLHDTVEALKERSLGYRILRWCGMVD